MRQTLHNIRAAIFDLDGTLFDSVGLWHDIDDIFLSKRGLTPTDEYKRNIVALGYRGTALYTIDYYKLSDTPEQLMDEWSDLARDAYAHTVELFPGVREYLEECRAAGIKIAAVTSLRADFAVSGLLNNGIRELFSHVFTVDETGLSKSSHEIYEHAARTLGVDCAECVAFDDVAVALKSAKTAGMKTVAVDGIMLDKSQCRDCADIIISSFASAPLLSFE